MDHYKDIKAWQQDGLQLSTTSDEAARLYDEVLSMLGRYEVDGVVEKIKTLQQVDPNYVMGHILLYVHTELIPCRYGPDTNIKIIDLLAKRMDVNMREKQHALAIKQLDSGHAIVAIEIYENILEKYHKDVLALRCFHAICFQMGAMKRCRDTYDRIIPLWSPSHPSYRTLIGLYSFVLVEAHDERAEEVVIKGLELNPYDVCLSHSMSHLLLEAGRYDEGIVFLEKQHSSYDVKNVNEMSHGLAQAVVSFFKGEHEVVLDMYDKTIVPECKNLSHMFNIINASSTLCYMKLEGIDVSDRWRELQQMWEIQSDNIYIHPMSYVHACMPVIATRDYSTFESIIDSAELFARSRKSDFSKVLSEVAIPVCEAIRSFEQEDFSHVVETMMPLRHKFLELGGSNVERDIIDKIFLHGALRSDKEQHHQYARLFMEERKTEKYSILLKEKLETKLMQMHT